MSKIDPLEYSAVIARLENQFEEVLGQDFYEELFPDNECSGEQCQDYSKRHLPVAGWQQATAADNAARRLVRGLPGLC